MYLHKIEDDNSIDYTSNFSLLCASAVVVLPTTCLLGGGYPLMIMQMLKCCGVGITPVVEASIAGGGAGALCVPTSCVYGVIAANNCCSFFGSSRSGTTGERKNLLTDKPAATTMAP
ncbi:MAG: hypothetical protein KAT71_06120 [Gammaproteobacteria bacterium]|nr:hypothetical protein [Gammaproteobacteria bacterium]